MLFYMPSCISSLVVWASRIRISISTISKMYSMRLIFRDSRGHFKRIWANLSLFLFICVTLFCWKWPFDDWWILVINWCTCSTTLHGYTPAYIRFLLQKICPIFSIALQHQHQPEHLLQDKIVSYFHVVFDKYLTYYPNVKVEIYSHQSDQHIRTIILSSSCNP